MLFKLVLVSLLVTSPYDHGEAIAYVETDIPKTPISLLEQLSSNAARALFKAVKASYKTAVYGTVVRLNSDIFEIGVKDQWYPLDGFSLVGPTQNITVHNNGVFVNHGSFFGIFAFANVAKVAAQNKIDVEFCVTINGICTGPTLKVTLFSPDHYTEANGFLLRSLKITERVGISVRNTSNAENIKFNLASITLLRQK